ncbi:stress responsive alpha-beta barrel domain-containing protein [Rhodococcus ruber BKS 20-38]|uniref:Stress responsive alpha-beta barrel domain-containing protein n=1 Tax=Rhodococcus ruber BKS 20-38 TaxID=1278076 RepID=M2YT51_9NOCA|nr:Dabb family protein [Rhodococcus ruber]EME51524.1 stress responsive alpha-beta barrel domain-containing protein [Rhodococcus ruber BKS 20-38]
MIRNIVLGFVRDGVGPTQVEEALAEVRRLRIDGISMTIRADSDLGLREGNASFALIVDLPDTEAYHRYDQDPMHARIRSEVLGPLCSRIERVQVPMPHTSGPTE